MKTKLGQKLLKKNSKKMDEIIVELQKLALQMNKDDRNTDLSMYGYTYKDYMKRYNELQDEITQTMGLERFLNEKK